MRQSVIRQRNALAENSTVNAAVNGNSVKLLAVLILEHRVRGGEVNHRNRITVDAELEEVREGKELQRRTLTFGECRSKGGKAAVIFAVIRFFIFRAEEIIELFAPFA